MRKTYKYLAATLVAAMVLTGGVIVNASQSKADAQQQAQVVAETYINALKAGDSEKAASLVDDLRYPDEVKKKQAYKRYVKLTHFEDVNLVSVVAENDEKANATIHIKTKEGREFDVTMPVLKENDQWKLFVDGKTAK